MVKRKRVRTRGKIPFSRYFQKLKIGERVAVLREMAVSASFPERLQGRTGVVEGKRGKAYFIKIADSNKDKRYLIEPVHLKKIQETK